MSLRTLAPSLLLVAYSAVALSAADTSYLVPAQGGVIVKPFATSGDSFTSGSGTKVLAGIPDGLGAFDNGNGTFTLISNHEIPSASGVARAHGGTGAFLSKFIVNKTTLAVTSLTDLITTVYVATRGSGAPTWGVGTNVIFNRFCSADLPAESAMFNPTGTLGVPATTGHLYFNGEEGSGGRALMHVCDGNFAGQTVELPHLGRFAFENLVACPTVQDKTVVMGIDDTSPGFVTMYVGTKQVLSNPVDARDLAVAAGLTNGLTYVVKANGLAAEDRTTLVGAAKATAVPFTMVALGTAGDVSTDLWDTNAEIRPDATAKGTSFLRPEDGCWDPVTPGVFYFLTTDRIDDTKDGLNGTTTAGAVPATGTAAVPQVGRSRLWKMVFANIATPETGGTITCLIDGSEDPGPQMMDNISADTHGRLLLCEDPGSNADFSARLWAFDIASSTLTVVAKHDPAFFGDYGRAAPGVANAITLPTAPYTRDEESSGVLDAEAILGAGWWLIDVQDHHAVAGEQYEGGQYMAVYVPTTFATGATLQSGRLATVTGTAVRDAGYGSAMAFVPGTTNQIWLLTDRGPNIDGTSGSKLFPLPSFTPRLGRFQLNGDGTADLKQVVQLKRANGTLLTGLPIPAGSGGSTGEVAYALDSAGVPGTAVLSDSEGIDSEGLVAHPNGTFWISDEYGPFLLNAAADGTTIERISATTVNSLGHKLPAVLARRIINKGMEGLTLTPDGTKLVGMMQSALGNGIPAPAAGAAADSESKKDSCVRILVYTLATGASAEYAYLLEDMVGGAAKGGSVSEIVAISNTEFLIDERDGKFLTESSSKIKSIFKINIAAATNINDPADAITGKLYTAKTPEELCYNITQAAANTALVAAGITPVTKSLVLDLKSGTYPARYNHDKIEGMALRGSILWLSNDDDFGVTDSSGLAPKNVDKTTGVTPQTRGLQDFGQVISIDLTSMSITATNSSPWVSTVANQSLVVGTTASPTVQVGDQETPAASLTLTATS